MALRACSSCHRQFDRWSYSGSQWSKGVGASRCKACVAGGGTMPPPAARLATARENNATQAAFEANALQFPFAEGSFRWVAKGVYTEGHRAGEPCVGKWFKTGGVVESSFFALDIKAMEKSLQLVDSWNNDRIISQVVRMNRPQVWTCTGGSKVGQKILQEPFVHNYQKFNSNTGWADDDFDWSRVMQALSHYSYHKSGGQFVLCDLQGGVYSDGAVLTDPVILSRSGGYGVTDLGARGISSFFNRHTCNEFCRRHWQKPRDLNAYFEEKQGTSMIAPQPAARHSRPPMTIFEGNEDYSDEGYCY